MTLNDKYCKLLNFDFGYDNQALADKIEELAKETAIDFSLWITQNEYQKTELTRYALWKVYKEQKGL